MLDERMNEREMDDRIVRALEAGPNAEWLIPEDFATRIAARVPAKRIVSLTPTHYGRNVMFASMAVLLAVLLVLAQGRPDTSIFGVAMEWCLYIQLIALAVWLSVKRWGLH